MAETDIEIELSSDQKYLLLKHAGFVIYNEETTKDLKDGRRKWIRFNQFGLDGIIGELCYVFNRMKDNWQSELLDDLIGHLEDYSKG